MAAFQTGKPAKPTRRNKGYMGNPYLKKVGEQIEFTTEQLEEYKKCKRDPIYFIEKYAKIVSLDDGIVPFKLFSFQKKLLRNVHTNKKSLGLLPRQMGKSQCVAAYVAWYVMFNKNKTAVIAANKLMIAKEIFGRSQFIIENTPKWLQQGVVEWNKTSLELENGSRCIASATSASAIRGMSCVSGDTKVTVRNKKTGIISLLSFDELAQALNIDVEDIESAVRNEQTNPDRLFQFE
jgi:hypothetical protein